MKSKLPKYIILLLVFHQLLHLANFPSPLYVAFLIFCSPLRCFFVLLICSILFTKLSLQVDSVININTFSSEIYHVISSWTEPHTQTPLHWHNLYLPHPRWENCFQLFLDKIPETIQISRLVKLWLQRQFPHTLRPICLAYRWHLRVTECNISAADRKILKTSVPQTSTATFDMLHCMYHNFTTDGNWV